MVGRVGDDAYGQVQLSNLAATLLCQTQSPATLTGGAFTRVRFKAVVPATPGLPQ